MINTFLFFSFKTTDNLKSEKLHQKILSDFIIMKIKNIIIN